MQGNIKFSKHLKRLMLDNHMTAYELSQKSGISKSYIYHLYSGYMNNPSVEACKRLAFSLGVEMEELLNYMEVEDE